MCKNLNTTRVQKITFWLENEAEILAQSMNLFFNLQGAFYFLHRNIPRVHSNVTRFYLRQLQNRIFFRFSVWQGNLGIIKRIEVFGSLSRFGFYFFCFVQSEEGFGICAELLAHSMSEAIKRKC